MRKLNVKFLLLLLAAVIVCGSGVALAHHLQYRRIPAALLLQADRAEQAGELNRVDDYLSRYLTFVPEDVEQRARLAKLLASRKMATNHRTQLNAIRVLEDVLGHDPGRHDLRRMLVPLALAVGKLSLAQKHLEVLSREAPQDGEVSALWGQWHEEKKDYAPAIKAYQTAIKHNPSLIEAYVRLAKLLRQRQWPTLPPEKALKNREADAAEADQVMAGLTTANPDSWQAHVARWNYLRDHHLQTLPRGVPLADRTAADRKKVEEAVKNADRALQLAEGEPDVRLAAAEADLARGELAGARAHLDRARQLHRDDPRIWRALATLELQEGESKPEPVRKTQRTKALAWLRQGIRELTGQAQVEVLYAYATTLLENATPADLEEADRTVARCRKTSMAPAWVDFLQGRVLYERQQWPEAVRFFERARPLIQTAPEISKATDFYLARCYQQLGEPGQQLEAWKRIAARDPNSLPARLGIAQAARELGRFEDAVAQYEALARLEELPFEVQADRFRLLLVRARQGGQPRDWENAREALDRIKTNDKLRPVQRSVLEAEYYVARGKLDLARDILEQANKDHPKEVLAWTALAYLHQRRKDLPAMAQVLSQAEKNPDLLMPSSELELRLAWAAYWVARKDGSTKKELARLACKTEVWDSAPQMYNRLLNGLAEAHFRAGDLDEAFSLWDQLARRSAYQNDLKMRLVLFDLAQQRGRQQDMERILGEIRKIEGGDGTFGRHAEALRLIWLVRQEKVTGEERTAALKKAQNLLIQIKNVRKNWPVVYLTEAEIAHLRGNLDQAVESYREARKYGERNLIVVRKLVEALREQQKYAEAEQVLRSLSKEELARGELERQAADLALLNNDAQRAIEISLQTVRADSRDYRDHLWVGEVLSRSGQRKKDAERHLRRAVEDAQGSHDPAAWVALVTFLAGEKREADARQVMKQAETALQGSERLATLARCHATLGQDREARQHYQQAVAGQAPVNLLREFAAYELRFNRFREGLELLQRILDPKTKAGPEDLEWAHTRLAVVLSSQKDFASFKKALLHVGLNLDASGNVIVDGSVFAGEGTRMKQVRARVLATQPQWRYREEAIKRFEELDSRQALTADDRHILARLYEARGNAWAKAKQQMVLATGSEARRPEHLAYHAELLLRLGEIDEAARVVARLAQMNQAQPAPNITLAVINLQAQLLEARGRGAQAVELLKKRIQNREAAPEEILLIISSLGRQRRFAEAIAMLEEVWKVCPPEMAGSTTVALLRAHKVEDARLGQINEWFRQAIQKNPKSTDLHVQWGDLHDLRGQYEEAEKAYREALKLDASNVMALNNLSWLLSQRLKKGQEALELINRAIDRSGPVAELLDTRAMAYLVLGRNKEAVADLNDAIKGSLTATRSFHLARAHHQDGNRNAARQALKQATDLGLKPATLHPVEQVALRQLKEDLGQ